MSDWREGERPVSAEFGAKWKALLGDLEAVWKRHGAAHPIMEEAEWASLLPGAPQERGASWNEFVLRKGELGVKVRLVYPGSDEEKAARRAFYDKKASDERI